MPFKETKEGQTNFDPITETTERIVIDYANLSGRENAPRGEFRRRVFQRLNDLMANKIDEIVKEVEKMDWECYEQTVIKKDIISFLKKKREIK